MIEEQEFLAEDGLDLSVISGALKRHWLLAVGGAIAIIVVGVAVISVLPATYRSTATILLEEPEVPEYLIQTTVTVFAAEQIQYINQRVMTRTNLSEIIEKFDLYADERRYTPTLLLTKKVQSNMHLDLINVELTDPARGASMLKAIAFTIGFRDEDPAVAQKVANELVSLYMEENVRSRTVQTVETRQFLTKEVDRLDERVKEIEEKMARFKEENEESLPTMLVMNQSLIRSTEDQLIETQRRLDSLEDTRIMLDSQLIQLKPTLPMMLPDGTTVVSPQDQLKALQTRLAMLQGQYSPDHPDVMRTRREVDALKAETGLTADLSDTTALLIDARNELAKANENYNDDHPEIQRLERLVNRLTVTITDSRDANDALVKPDNPAYIQLGAQKETLVVNEAMLRSEERRLRLRLADYEQRMLKTPAVEQELIALQRELQSATSRYFGMRDRQFGAEMGEALETQSKGERFVLVEPANFPLEPASPNRPALILMLLVLAPAASFGLIVLRTLMDHSIRGTKMLDSIQGGPPIAEIPFIVTQAELNTTRRIRIAALAGLPAAILLAVATVHFVIRPLDVVWFVALRKLGI
jgi:succinoglycan biosynthesis transport protein ExoP